MAGRRHAHEHSAKRHQRAIDRPHRDERLPHAGVTRCAERVHQFHRERRAHHRAAAKAHDRQPRRHAGPVGEPLEQRRDRRDVAEPEAHAAERAIAEQQQRQRVPRDAERGDQEAAGEAARRGRHGLARAAALDPRAEQRRRQPEAEEREVERPDRGRHRPVAGRWRVATEQPGQRNMEDAERVRLPDRKVHGERGGRHEPARPTGPGDGARAIEAGEHGRSVGSGATAARPARHACMASGLMCRVRHNSSNRAAARPHSRARRRFAAQSVARPMWRCTLAASTQTSG